MAENDLLINELALELARAIQAITHCSNDAMRNLEQLLTEFGKEVRRQASE